MSRASASNSKKPRVLVLLAARNGAPWIAEQVTSILGQSGVAIDLIVSDDCSTDDTRARLKQFESDSRVHLIFRENSSGAAAQHFLALIRSVSIRDHAFVAFSDQDDVWLEHKILRGCQAIDSAEAAGYSSATTAFWSDGRERHIIQVPHVTRHDFLFEGAGQGCTFILSAVFFCRMQAFLLGHNPETGKLHYHDWAIYALSRVWSLIWVFDSEPTLRYRQHAANDTGARHSSRGVQKRLARLRNKWYQRQLRVIAELCLAAAPEANELRIWHDLLEEKQGVARQWKILRFLVRGGRRRSLDTAVLLFAALARWI